MTISSGSTSAPIRTSWATFRSTAFVVVDPFFTLPVSCYLKGFKGLILISSESQISRMPCHNSLLQGRVFHPSSFISSVAGSNVLYYVNKTRDKGLSFDHAPEPAARSSRAGTGSGSAIPVSGIPGFTGIIDDLKRFDRERDCSDRALQRPRRAGSRCMPAEGRWF